MIKKLLFLLLTCNALQSNNYPQSVPLEKLFSDEDLALSVREQEEVNELIHTLKNSSVHEQIETAQEAAYVLDKEIEQRRLLYKAAEEQDKEFIGYKAGILIAQSDWCKRIAKKMSQCLPLHKRASRFCRKYVKRLKTKTAQFLKRPTYHSSLTNQLLSYARLEREKILNTYPSTVALAVAHEHKDLPELMAFWSNQRRQWLLLTESKKHLYTPRIQADLFDSGAAEAEDAAIAAAEAGARETAQQATARVGGTEEGGSGVDYQSGENMGAFKTELTGDIVADADAIAAGDALTNLDEVNGVIKKNLERLSRVWSKAEEVGGETADTLKSFWNKIPGHSFIDFFPKMAGDITEKVFMGPFRSFMKMAGDMLPPVESMGDLTASIAEGTLTTDLVASDAALEMSEETVEDFASRAKSLEFRTRKAVLPRLYTRLFSKAVTPEELEGLSDAAAANNLKGAMQLQLTQARADAVSILNDEAPKTVWGKFMRFMRGARGSAQSGLRDLDSSAGDNLTQAAQALRRSEGLADGAMGPMNKGTEDLVDQVKELREQLTTPLTKSGRYLRMMGNMNKAFAARYPILHGCVQMMFFMDAMMGAQLAISWENQKQAKEYIAMTQKRNAIDSKFQSKISEIELTKAASMRQIRANKLKLLTTMSTINQKLNTGTIQETNYIVQSVAGHTLQHIYVSNPMTYDQYFYYSPMLTPNQEEPLFPQKEGDSRWVIQPQKPIILNQLTAGWIVSQNKSDAPTAPGTGAWVVGAKENREESTPVSFSQKFSIPKDYPTNAVAHTWYNPFRSGNWIFNPDANTFFQYLAAPITSTKSPQGDPSQALQNSIFTEYVPPLILNEQGIATYVVQVEMKIYQAEFPFFAGIFFNGGRWISGSKDLRTQHRLFGLYGNLNKEISVYGTETAYISSKDQLLEKTSLTALDQVFATPEEQKAWQATYRSLIPNPLYPNKKENSTQLEVGKTYILTAATQPTRIMLMLEEKTEQGSTPVFGPYTIAHRNPFIFIYHNIGFISGGCSTGFKLLQPKQLLYDQNALDEFKRKIGLSETSPEGRA